MIETKMPIIPPGLTKSPPLHVPVGEVQITREAAFALLASSVSLDDVLKWHATGYGSDPDQEHDWDNYELAEVGGANVSIHYLHFEDEYRVPVQLRVETPANRRVTMISIHTRAE